jgi:hypothetical protein
MADYRTIKGTVKSVNKANSGFTLVEEPDVWLNYSKQGDAAKVKRDAQRGDVVEVRVNDSNWIQSLTIEQAAPRQQASSGSSGAAAAPGAGSGWQSRDPNESKHIGRQVALKSAVELMGYLPTIEPTIEALDARIDLLLRAADRFSVFVNAPLDAALAARTAGQQPQTAQTSSQSAGAGSASSMAQRDNVTSIVYCQRDGKPVKGVRFQDGTTWTADELVSQGKALCGETLCSTHYFEERDNPEKQKARAAAVAAAHGVTQGVPEQPATASAS